MRLKSDMNLAEIQTHTWTVLQEAAELCTVYTYMMYHMLMERQTCNMYQMHRNAYREIASKAKDKH